MKQMGPIWSEVGVTGRRCSR